MQELPELVVADVAAWRAWLGEHHGEPGVWLVLAKKGATAPTTLTHDMALEEALCHGWIDGQARRRDDATSLQRFTPRRARSTWSARNVRIVEQLTHDGRMHPAGVAEVERAKADGRWDNAYEGVEKMPVPDELVAALEDSPAAKAMFEQLTSQNRFAILFRLHQVKRTETRTRNVAKFVAMLERGETIYPQRKPGG